MEILIDKCGDDLKVVLPPEVESKLGWSSGDILSCEVVDGGLRFGRIMSKHEHAMKIAREGMEKYHDALKTLAKSE